MRSAGTPLDGLEIQDEAPRDTYGYELLQLRPDLHVVWRGNQAPAEEEGVAAVAIRRGLVAQVSPCVLWDLPLPERTD